MASNQSWNEERTQPRKRGGGIHKLKETNKLAAKMDLIMKKLEEKDSEKREVMHINNSLMTCEECGSYGHSGKNCPELQEDMNNLNNNNNNYHPQQPQGWNQQQRPNYSGNYQGNFHGNNFNQPPFRELIASQSRLIE